MRMRGGNRRAVTISYRCLISLSREPTYRTCAGAAWGRQFLGSSIARSAMAGLFRLMDALSANRRAVLAPELAAIRAALEKAGAAFIEEENGGWPGESLP